jgi:hypothetical protein
MIKGWQPTKRFDASKRPPNVNSGVQTPMFRNPTPPPPPNMAYAKPLMLYMPDESRLVEVYDITYNSNGYPLFLIYLDGQWLRKSAKHFRPID